MAIPYVLLFSSEFCFLAKSGVVILGVDVCLDNSKHASMVAPKRKNVATPRLQASLPLAFDRHRYHCIAKPGYIQ
jgi:hypothetical protein